MYLGVRRPCFVRKPVSSFYVPLLRTNVCRGLTVAPVDPAHNFHQLATVTLCVLQTADSAVAAMSLGTASQG